MSVPAAHWTLSNSHVLCGLCPHHCVIENNHTGICRVRRAENNSLKAESYGAISSMALDPVEKKPLYHFYPGSYVLSIGSVGCNLRCPYCQNWQISQTNDIPTQYLSPNDLLKSAIAKKSIGIAYTYSEPIVWFEFVLECAKAFRKAGLKNVMVTNGYIEKEPLKELLPYIDAWNIDLKTFRDQTYKKVLHGSLEPVLNTIKRAASASHVEVTTLVVPGMNDDIKELTELAAWLSSVNNLIPFHISRYFPNYKYNNDPTDIKFMIAYYGIAKKYLKYVYCGNISGHLNTQSTFCSNCGSVLINRDGYRTEINNIVDGSCAQCKSKVDIIF